MSLIRRNSVSSFYTAIVAMLCVATVFLSSAQAEETEARDFVQQLGDNVLSVIEDKNATSAVKEDKLVELFADAVDVDWIGKFVLGKYWRQATDDQKARYADLYKPFLLRSYASRFNEYNDEQGNGFKITGSRPLQENEYQVDSVIMRNGDKPPVAVSYRVRKETDHFKLFDVIIEGVSQLSTQRSEFGAVAGREGIDSLLSRLEQKVNALNG